jgi:hypothetical protein
MRHIFIIPIAAALVFEPLAFNSPEGGSSCPGSLFPGVLRQEQTSQFKRLVSQIVSLVHGFFCACNPQQPLICGVDGPGGVRRAGYGLSLDFFKLAGFPPNASMASAGDQGGFLGQLFGAA